MLPVIQTSNIILHRIISEDCAWRLYISTCFIQEITWLFIILLLIKKLFYCSLYQSTTLSRSLKFHLWYQQAYFSSNWYLILLGCQAAATPHDCPFALSLGEPDNLFHFLFGKSKCRTKYLMENDAFSILVP